MDYSGSIKVLETEDPERFNKQIKRPSLVAAIYLIIGIIFLGLFLFVKI